MHDIKAALAKNITALRQEKGMTQLELAEHLNYSDKAVSKWERAESMPDVTVLAQIAELFSVTLDDLIREEGQAKPAVQMEKPTANYNRPAITAVSLLLVCMLGCLAFILVHMIAKNWGYAWLCFVYTLPVAMIVWLVFNSLWFNKKRNYLIVSLLMWSVLASVQLSILPIGVNISLIYLLGAVGQIIILLWAKIKK